MNENILFGLLTLTQCTAFSQSIGYRDLSGTWQVYQNDIWYKHISVDFVSKNHEYSWSQLIDEKDFISRSIIGDFDILKRNSEYVLILNGKVSLSTTNVPAKTIRFFLRNNTDNYLIQFLNAKPGKNEKWDSVNEESTYTLKLYIRTNE